MRSEKINKKNGDGVKDRERESKRRKHFFFFVGGGFVLFPETFQRENVSFSNGTPQ